MVDALTMAVIRFSQFINEVWNDDDTTSINALRHFHLPNHTPFEIQYFFMNFLHQKIKPPLLTVCYHIQFSPPHNPITKQHTKKNSDDKHEQTHPFFLRHRVSTTPSMMTVATSSIIFTSIISNSAFISSISNVIFRFPLPVFATIICSLPFDWKDDVYNLLFRRRRISNRGRPISRSCLEPLLHFIIFTILRLFLCRTL